MRPTTTVQATDSADQVLEGFSHYVTNEGVRRSRVEADTAFYYEPTQITELHKIKVVFFDLKGDRRVDADGPAGDVSLAGRVDGGDGERPGRSRPTGAGSRPSPCATTMPRTDHDRQAIHLRPR